MLHWKGCLKISRSKRKRLNNIAPKNNVDSQFNKIDTHENISVELSAYPKWLDSVDLKDFNNFYRDYQEMCAVLKVIMVETIPFLKEHGMEILQGKCQHCHVIGDDKTNLITRIVKKINKFDLDPEITLWEVAANNSGGVRVICGIDKVGDHIYFYPLFIDIHHQIYPNNRFRGNYSKICKYNIYDVKKPNY